MYQTPLFRFLLASTCLTLISFFLYRSPSIVLQRIDDFGLSLASAPEPDSKGPPRADVSNDGRIEVGVHWSNTSELFPVSSAAALPKGQPWHLPLIQQSGTAWKAEDDSVSDARKTVAQVKQQIKAAFLHSWQHYKDLAWGYDELAPLSGLAVNPFNGWGTTMIEALETLWLMGLKDEFEGTVVFVAGIDFTTSRRRHIPIHEAAVRCLGGLIGAYEVSERRFPELLEKARELGDVLMGAFDTPNRMPINFYDWTPESTSKPHRASSASTLPDLASMTLEFTRLSQLTGDAKYFDAVDRVLAALEAFQQHTSLPGLWPASLDASGCKRAPRLGNGCTKGGLVSSSSAAPSEDVFSMADGAAAVYTSLLKQQILLGVSPAASSSLGPSSVSSSSRAGQMYAAAQGPMHESLLFRPLVGGAPDLLMLGDWVVDKQSNSWLGFTHASSLEPRMARSSCATASMLALGGAALERPDDVVTASKLLDGCLWAHDKSRSGLMPASFSMLACESRETCGWGVDEMHAWWDALDLRLREDFDLADYYAVGEGEADGSEDDGEGDGLFEARDTHAIDRAGDQDSHKNNLNSTGAGVTQSDRPSSGPNWESISPSDPDADSTSDPASSSSPTHISESGSSSSSTNPPSFSSHNPASSSPTPSSSPSPSPHHFNPLLSQTLTRPSPFLGHEDFVRDRIWAEGLAEGMLDMHDRTHDLGPEIAEALFTLYRVTGDARWREQGVRLFSVLDRVTRTRFGFAGVGDVSVEVDLEVSADEQARTRQRGVEKRTTEEDETEGDEEEDEDENEMIEEDSLLRDVMPSFWTGATLKYFWLLMSDETVLSLDEWVFSAGGHAFRMDAQAEGRADASVHVDSDARAGADAGPGAVSDAVTGASGAGAG